MQKKIPRTAQSFRVVLVWVAVTSIGVSACSSADEPGSTSGGGDGSTTANASTTAGSNTASDSNLTNSASTSGSTTGGMVSTTGVTTASNTTGTVETTSGTTSAALSSSNTTGTASTSGSTSAGGAGGAGSTVGTEGSTTGGTTAGTPSSGCGTGAPEGGRFDIDVDGLTREYILRVPDNYDPDRAYPLVFAWHPWGGSAEQTAGNGFGGGYYGLASAAGDQTILVSPEGIDFGGNGLGWENPNGRDENFMRAMLTRFEEEMCVDEGRVFSTGFSFGGMMSFALGCDAADVIRAVAPQAGNTSVSGCSNSDLPVALMGFHGTEDTVVDIDGGRTGRDKILARNGCSQTSTPIDGGWCDVAGDNYQPCTCVSYDGCMDGYPVIWCEFTGPHTPAPNAGQTLWDFFSQF